MSTRFLQGESEGTELVDDESSISKKVRNYPMKYWRFVFAASVLGFRFQHSDSEDCEKKKSSTEVVGSSSDTVLHVEPESTPEFKTDQTTLRQLVEEENVELLQELGGVNGVAAALNADLVHGIHDQVEDIERRRQKYGANTLPNPPKKSFFQFVWRALLDRNILILIIFGSVSLGLGIKVEGPKRGWKDGGSLLIGIFFAVIFIAISDCLLNKVFNKLLKDSYVIEIDVVRGGRCQPIPVKEIVVGDVVSLKYGDKVPAHGLIVEAHSLKLQGDKTREKRDQADHVKLNPVNKSPFLFSGTEVVDGFAWMLVTSVGMNAKRGQMRSQTSHESMNPIPLEDQLEEVDSTTDVAGYLVTLVVVLLFLTGKISFTIPENGVEKPATGRAKIYVIVCAIVGLITSVVNITNPLQLSLKLTRAYAMENLKAKNAMVRELSALETISFVDTICINKTGTLTVSQMKVSKFFLGNDFVAEETYLLITPKVKKLLQEGIALNSLCGNPTEKAILSWGFEVLGMDMKDIKMNHDILHIEAFSSERKQSSILAQKKGHDTIQVHLKGDADLILEMCSRYYDASGIIEDLDDNQRKEFKQAIQCMAASKLRCIAIAHKEAEAKELEHENKAIMLKDGMTLIGIVGVSDPCRQGVSDAVKNLQKVKLNIKMITGENIFNAKAIATECGILAPDSGAVIEAVEFRNYTREERMKKVDEICVMASSSPSDKRLMVQCLKEKGNVVAFVGRGSNNSLALKEANIGVFMGIQGTEVTEESSGIVISDGDFRSIPEILELGRCVYSNIQKFIQFQLTASSSALISNFVGLFVVQVLTLTTVQLLWVSLITESLACLAFATEKPTKELMEKPPVCQKDPLVTNIMLRNVFLQALFQTALLFQIQNHVLRSSSDDKVLLTFIFTSYVLCQVFNQVNSRKLEKKNVFEKIHSNSLFLLIALVIIILQILLVETLKVIADTKRLNWSQWVSCIGIAALTLPIGLVARFIPVPEKQVMSYLMVVGIIGRLILRKLTSVLTWASQVLYFMHRNQQLRKPLAITDRHGE